RDAPDARPLGEIRGEVHFDSVSFSYDANTPVLRDVDVRIEAGATVAIVGEAGSGKSTLVNLIPRFYDPTTGSVKVDGVDVRTVTLESLRRQVGIIPQEPFLFSTSIRENIAFGRDDMSEEEI